MPVDSLLEYDHPQRMLDLALSEGKAIFPIQCDPVVEGVQVYQEPLKRFEAYLDKYVGVLCGTYKGVNHAVFWDGRIVDPFGRHIEMREMAYREFFVTGAQV